MKIKVLISLVIIPMIWIAQKSDEKKMTTWIEYKLEDNEKMNFEYYEAEYRIKSHNLSYTNTIKTDVTFLNRSSNKYFTECILKKLETNSLDAFPIGDKSNKLTNTDIINSYLVNDTFFIDSSGKEYSFIRMDKSHEINRFKIKQEWEITESRIENKIKEIRPIITFKSGIGTQVKKELFDIPLTESKPPEIININNPEDVWIKYTIDYLDLKKINLSPKEKKNLKKLLWTNPKDQIIPIYGIENGIFHLDKESIINFEKRVLKPQIDTVITFHPETLKENRQIIRTGGYEYKDIVGIKIYQLWSWDDEKNKLKSAILGIAPVAKKKYIRTLFHIKLMNIK